MKRTQFEKYRQPIIDLVKDNGIDKLGQYGADMGVPLIYLYEFISEDTNDFDLKQHCDYKIGYLSKFYQGTFNE